MKSKDIYTERYDYIVTSSAKILPLFKARPGSYYKVIFVSAYNTNAQNLIVYWGLTRRGKLIRLAGDTTVATDAVMTLFDPVYLIGGDELVIRAHMFSGSAVCFFGVQVLQFRDGEK